MTPAPSPKGHQRSRRHTAEHARFLRDEADRVAVLTQAARVPDGFGWLGPDGRLADLSVQLWIACRMTHVAGLSLLADLPGTAGSEPVDQRAVLEHGVAALSGPLADHEHGGWFSTVGPDGPQTDEKQAYDHAFVVLTASTAVAAGAAGADALLGRALACLDDHFWDAGHEMMVETWDRSFTRLDDYRGVNSNMHSVEALLAAADVTGDRLLVERAARIVGRVVDLAATNDWRVPEHFGADWQPRLDYNSDKRADQFRPYGATVGHGMEWARLLLHLDSADGGDRTAAAVALYDRAVADGWRADGTDGFLYTTDWSGRPVTRTRMHWVCCEAIAAAAALAEATGDPRFEADYERWWDYAVRYLVDLHGGSWRHELDPVNQPASTVWSGKPDLYHAVQACLLPLGPVVASAATAARASARRS